MAILDLTDDGSPIESIKVADNLFINDLNSATSIEFGNYDTDYDFSVRWEDIPQLIKGLQKALELKGKQ